jgi:GntR family transcriptional regulator, transcriptional repressor for pyruvate dehydrogenase complex
VTRNGARPVTRIAAFSRVRVPKAAEVIADTLRTRIARGELRAGDALPGEADLIKQFGVSRPTLREALRILEAQALINVARGARGGARIEIPSSRLAARHVALLLQVQGATLADVYEARLLIEPSAARLAAERAPTPAAKALREIIRAEEEALGDAEAFSRAAIRFQERLVEVSGNRTLGLLTHMLRDVVEMQRRAGVARNDTYPDRLSVRRKVVDAHRRVAALIGAGNGVKAEAQWRQFLSDVAAIVLGPRAARTVVAHAH